MTAEVRRGDAYDQKDYELPAGTLRITAYRETGSGFFLPGGIYVFSMKKNQGPWEEFFETRCDDPRPIPYRLRSVGNKLRYAYAYSDCLVTPDGGTTWHAFTAGKDTPADMTRQEYFWISSVLFDAEGRGEMQLFSYMQEGPAFLETTDAGKTWTSGGGDRPVSIKDAPGPPNPLLPLAFGREWTFVTDGDETVIVRVRDRLERVGLTPCWVLETTKTSEFFSNPIYLAVSPTEVSLRKFGTRRIQLSLSAPASDVEPEEGRTERWGGTFYHFTEGTYESETVETTSGKSEARTSLITFHGENRTSAKLKIWWVEGKGPVQIEFTSDIGGTSRTESWKMR
jgi:hypothetical protein